MALGATTHTLPYDWYRDEGVARLETERVFAHTWQYLGHTGQVTETGCFTTGWAGRVPVAMMRRARRPLPRPAARGSRRPCRAARTR